MTQATSAHSADTKTTQQKAHELHYSIAEQGKVYALKGKHQDALKHYREAIRMAVSIKAPEVFFRHYTQCVLESLELTGSYDEVIEYCVNADVHYQKIETKIPLHIKDHAATMERKGINELKAGHIDQGKATIQTTINMVEKGQLPLSEELMAWLSRGLSVDVSRLVSLQKKHKYFVVRKDQVDAKRARSLDSLKKPSSKSASSLNELLT